MKINYQTTMKACFVGYVVQAIVNNFVPLLFVTFQNTYDISLSKITLLITVNFGVQLLIDLGSTLFVDKIGYKISVVVAHVFSILGFVSLTILPEILEPFSGILLSVIIYAIGGGLLEVLISPIMESCPTKNKEKAMSLLHSFYCWGHVGVVLFTTIFFQLFGINNWKVLTLIWAVVPLLNGILFVKTPIAPLISDGETGIMIKDLFKNKVFWILLIMMVCTGASEQAVSQWASVFAERGLGISKTMGDLAGPMAFAIMMGSSRALYGKYGHRINLNKFMRNSAVLCIVAYLTIALIPSAIISLVACAVCGFSVGIMWPGTFSKATVSLKNGGTAMFAIMALAGDLGCSAGPLLVGEIAKTVNNNLKIGILGAVVFPISFAFSLLKICRSRDKESKYRI